MACEFEDNEVVSLLGRLVACPSVNPAGAPDRAEITGEARMAELLTEIVRPWGAAVRVEEFAPGRVNFLAEFPGRRDDRTLLLDAHADTVAVEGMTIPPFEPAVRDGRLYGRGACDTKGAMAAMLLAVRSVLDDAGRAPVRVVFAATGDEEVASAGARALLAGGFRADAAIVAEPTGLDVVALHKGVLRCVIETLGRACHSSAPDQGVNAIVKMADVVALLSGRVQARLAGRVHPRLGPGTLSVGTIRGGSQPNIVPASCRIEVDRRLLPDERSEDVLAQMRRDLDSLAAADPDFGYRLEVGPGYPPLSDADNGPLARLARDACRRRQGRGEITVAHYTTNAGVYAEAGIPSIVLGPGSAAQAHTVDEYIELQAVADAAGVYAEAIEAFARQA